EAWKRSLLERAGEDTTVTVTITGLPARVVRNAYVAEYTASGAPILPPLIQSNAAQDVFGAATARGDGDHFPQFSGQSLGLIHDLPGAGEVVARLVSEMEAARARLPGEPPSPRGGRSRG